jgi:hypothetical protein
MSSVVSSRFRQPSDFIIGAVGHRCLPSERASLFVEISRTLRELIDRQAGDSRQTKLLVSLAEGADRLFIDAAVALDIPYVCALPCSPECFEEDFADSASIAQFRAQLAGAQSYVQPDVDPADRVAGYLWASRYIVDRADVLVAVWDGAPANGPAGTAESVEEAGGRSIPVIWIPVEPPHEAVALAPTSARTD